MDNFKMNFQELVAYCGGKQIDVARKFNKTKGTISIWKTNGIPDSAQYKIEVLTNGQLKADKQPKAA